MVGQVLVNAIFCSGQLIALVFGFVALFTNQWIRGVRSDDAKDQYFRRVEALDNEYIITGGQDDVYSSAGLFRLWATGRISYPLPIVDTELKMCKGGLTCGIVIGTILLYTVSFQMFKLFKGNLALELLIGWAAVFQALMTLAAVAVGMNYFKNTFSYDNSGVSLFSGWIAFCVHLMLIACTVFKVLLAHKTAREEKRTKKEEEATLAKQQPVYEKLTLRSAGSENRLYQPAAGGPPTGSRPGTADRSRQPEYIREGSRPGTMQSQQRYDPGPSDYPMRRAPSQDSKQFEFPRQQSPPPRGGNGGDRNEFMYYDQGDMPRHIR